MPKRHAAVHFLEYAAVRVLADLVQTADPTQNLQTAAAIGSIVHRSSPRRRLRMEDNVRRCFPELDDRRVAQVAERSMQHLFQLFMVDILVTPRHVTRSNWNRAIQLGDLKGVLDHLIRGDPIIMVTGHCGNWEVTPQALAAFGYPMTALARPIDNPYINRWVLSVREAQGTRILTKWGATPVIHEALRANGRIGFIADQNAGDQGLFVPFFGRLASTYKSIGLLALHHEAPIAAGFARRVNDRLCFELGCTDLVRPDDWADQPDPLYYITARFTRAIEQMVRQAPEQYLWVHRRWKSRPRHEREGKPMPRRLIEKLEALPWMTQSELDRLRDPD